MNEVLQQLNDRKSVRVFEERVNVMSKKMSTFKIEFLKKRI